MGKFAPSGIALMNLVVYGVAFMHDVRQRHKRHGLILWSCAERESSARGFEPARWVAGFALELQGGQGLLLLFRSKVTVPLLAWFFFEACGQYQRAIHRRLKTFLVGHGRRVQVHGKT